MRFDEAKADRALVRKGGFGMFVRLAWPAMPSIVAETLKWNWHHDLICAHYEAVLRGELSKLVLNVPPGHTKSLITSVFLPAYAWGPGKLPGWKALYASFDIELSRRDSTKCKDLVLSRWYQERWGFRADQKQLAAEGLTPVTTGSKAKKEGLDETSKADSATVWYNSAGGMRLAVSTAGKGTGWHAHAVFVDDPTKPDTIKNGGDEARKALADTANWWSGTMASRRVDPARFAQVVIMQRLHTDDLAGVCVKDGYTHVCLPAEFDPKRACSTPWGSDPRTQAGELLWPAHVTPEALADLKNSLGAHASAQLNQDPIPEGGLIFQSQWLQKRYSVPPRRFDKQWQSWDATFSETGSSFVVGQVWGRVGPDYYLLYQIRRRMGFVDTCQAIEAVIAKFPKARLKLIEKKANGAAIIDSLKAKYRFVPIEPEGGKVARANRCTDLFASGSVHLPENPEAWAGDGSLQDYIAELEKFPQGSNDDQVDCTTQSLNEVDNNGGGLAGLIAAFGTPSP